MNTILRRIALTTGAVAAATVLGGGVASAHLAVEAPGAKQGSSAVLSFRISNESEEASTTTLTVEVPGLKTARTEPMPGWDAVVQRDPNKMATSVTWTAAPGAGVGPGQFQRFVLYAGPLPKQDTVAFKAVQTYSDGKVVTWDQPTAAGAAEPEFPLPVLALTAAEPGDGHSHGTEPEKPQAAAPHAETDTETDSAARWLGIGGLALGGLGAVAGVGALARTRRSSE
ncbi:YcnI family copper-binding membrane protein [Nocardia salmonicida]|uniref:YcnI family copper-binding membrane protein n=1 Tax=Nocardia salmonicida TaxID=53431 RepID=UPI0007A37856|nr:YcnI family protein [Nocardia salmonicida]